MWKSRKQKLIEGSMRVRWGRPQSQRIILQEKKQKQQSGTRIALLISLILHLAVLFAMKDVLLHHRVHQIYNSIHVALIKSDSITESPPLKRRAVKPIKPRRKVPAEVTSGSLVQDKIQERSIRPNPENEKVSETRIPTMSTSISKDRPLPNPANAGTSAIGASSQNQGKGERSSGGGRSDRGLGGLSSVSSDKGLTDGSSLGDDFEVHAQADIPFIKALEEIARHVVKVRKSQKVDIVFIVDTSESMKNDIDAVRRHLYRMIERLELAGLDFTLGVVRFHHSLIYEWLGMDITISPQTSNVDEIRDILRSINVSGGERALDALMKAISKVEFRPGADRHFILVTDEYVHGTYPVPEVLKAAKRAKITIDVLGRDEVFQRAIAEQTGGIWTPIRKVISGYKR